MTRIAGFLDRNSADSSSLVGDLPGQRTFRDWLMGGLAFSLPIMIFSLVAFALYLMLA